MIKGIDKLQKKFDRLADEETYKKPLGKAAAIVERDAKKNTPVQTGKLRQSIGIEVKGLQAKIGTTLFYAPMVELGTGLFAEGGVGRQTPWSYTTADGRWFTTSGQRAQPFLRPALHQNREKIVRILNQALSEEVNK